MKITTHRDGSPLNAHTVVNVNDAPCPASGACHRYTIQPDSMHPDWVLYLDFQHGDAGDVKDATFVNGVSDEALLAVLLHRFHGFQTGPHACEETDGALCAVADALVWMTQRQARIEHQAKEAQDREAQDIHDTAEADLADQEERR